MGLPQAAIISSDDPLLSALANNGGPTQTMAITSSSPAYAVGTPVSGITTDQRGVVRSATTPSLGAYDLPNTTTAASNATATFSTGAQNVTLTANVTSSAGTVNEGTVTFTLEQGSTTIGTATTSTTVSGGAASVTYVLPAGTAAGTYTIDAVFNPGADYSTSSDTAHTLSIASAASTVTVGNATAVFSASSQTLALTANVSSGAAPVQKGTVTFTVMQGSTVIGTTTAASVGNGSARGEYVLPSRTSPGSYTIQADYHDDTGTFADGSGSASLTVSAAATTVQLSQLNIVPNLLNFTAEVTLTAQVGSAAGNVNEGNISFSFAGHSGVGGVHNGTASVQFLVPLLEVSRAQTVSLTYADAASPAQFGASGGAVAAHLSLLNLLMPVDMSFASNNGQNTQSILFPFGQLVYTNQRLTELRFGPLSVEVGYLNFRGLTVVTLDGIPSLILF